MENLQIASLNVRGLQNKNKEIEYSNILNPKNMTSYYYKKHIARCKMKIYGKRNRKAPPFSPVLITTNVE